jgi:hypothetical protein
MKSMRNILNSTQFSTKINIIHRKLDRATRQLSSFYFDPFLLSINNQMKILSSLLTHSILELSLFQDI